MKNLYYLGLGPDKFVSIDLKPYYKGWMITRIFGPEDMHEKEYDIQLLNEIVSDADSEFTLLYIDPALWEGGAFERYKFLGFESYQGLPRRRPKFRG